MTDNTYIEKLSGSGGGSGHYSMYYASRGRKMVSVCDLPENIGTIRIKLTDLDVQQTIAIDEVHAHCLWAALSKLAKDMNWSMET